MVVDHNHKDLGTSLVQCSLEILDKVTELVIIASWRRVGLVPWDEKIILEHAKESSSMVSTEAPTSHELVVGAMQTYIEGCVDPTHGVAPIRTIKVRPPKHLLYSGEEVVAMHEQKRKDDHEKRQEKIRIHIEKENAKTEAVEARRVKKSHLSCKGTLHGENEIKVWQGSSKWEWCEYCDFYGHCADCKEVNRDLMLEHENSHT